MFSIFIIAEESKRLEELHLRLVQDGYVCSIASDGEEVASEVVEKAPDLILMESNSYSRLRELSHRIKQDKNLPIIALVNRETLNNVDGHLDMVDDFITKPYDLRELRLRLKRLVRETNSSDNGELIRCGDLVIDKAKCEVALSGRVVILTFMEYELLKFLASNKGRVFTREVLLDRVWGYDYYGGDRTVDVHIRRLRSKIEDSSHTFIETVRNIGYRFKDNTRLL